MEDRDVYYRKQASDAQDQAGRAKSDIDKASWLKLARDWLALLSHKPTAEEEFDAAETKSGTHQQKSDESH